MLTWLLAAGLLGGNSLAATPSPCLSGVKQSTTRGCECCCRTRQAACRPCCAAKATVERPCCRRGNDADGMGFRAAGCHCRAQAPKPAVPARESRATVERIQLLLTAWLAAPQEKQRVGLDRRDPLVNGGAWHTGPPLRVWLCDWRI
jgi:hypothetical protein